MHKIHTDNTTDIAVKLIFYFKMIQSYHSFSSLQILQDISKLSTSNSVKSSLSSSSSSSSLPPVENVSPLRASEDMAFLKQEYEHLMEIGKVMMK